MKINTTLSLDSIRNCYCKPARFTCTIIKGSSAELIFDLNKYLYLVDDKDPLKYIDQITFMLQQGRTVYYYNVFTEDKKLNPNCGFYKDELYISCMLSPQETSQFKVAGEDNPVLYEIAIQANTQDILEQKVDSTLIEKQLPILVSDSIYSKVGGN